ncbi:MAG: TIR domain-containing protein [Desulfobacterales bacterium]|nr:TIR domain-containing protein [Desulfobacterales bacterium]
MMSEKNEKMKVFISYASEDIKTARKLYHDLKEAGVTPWMDEIDLLTGQNRKFEIRQAIKGSSYFLALLSSDSVSKQGYVQKELKMALDILAELPKSKIFILPLRLDDCSPLDEALQEIHWSNLFPDYEKGLNDILRVLCPDKEPAEDWEPAVSDMQKSDYLYGYVYQIWHSLHAWLELSNEEILFLEGAEGFDMVGKESATAVQVKDTAQNITLRSPDVIKAINNYWTLRKKHAGKTIFFRFLTISNIGIEKENPFGKKVAGLVLWNKCSVNMPQSIEKMRKFLLDNASLQKDLLDFLSDSDSETIFKELIFPICWETGSQDTGYVQKAIERKLIIHGEKYNIPPSKAASASIVNSLLNEIFTAACREEHNILERALFLRIFEEETTEHNPSHQTHQIKKIAQAVETANPMLMMMLAGGQKSPSLQPSPFIQIFIPSLPSNFSERKQIVTELTTFLNKNVILILIGSTGMGKTTLAKLIARMNGEHWRQLNFSNCDSKEISNTLWQLGIFLEQNQDINSIILDDIDFSSSGVRQYEDLLGGLYYTILKRNGRIIITSRKKIPDRLSRTLGFNIDIQKQVPYFDEEELIEFAVQLGCPQDKYLKNRVRIIHLQTRGHPQLIHAQLIYLSNNQWPKPKLDDLLSTSPDINNERIASRELLSHLTDEQRELLYRLSLIINDFRRDQAISVGEISPEITHPGDIFDSLVGPWIENISENYYHLSPLLQNSAKQIWSEDKVKSYYASVGKAIISCENLSTLEAQNVLLYGMISRSTELMVTILNGIITAPEHVWKCMVRNLTWVMYIKPDVRPFPENNFVNYMLRFLQFRIAAEQDPETAASIIEVWDNEILPNNSENAYLTERFMFLTKIILSFKVKISPSKFINYLSELYEIDEKFKKSEELSSILGNFPRFRNNWDYYTILFSFIIPRCSSYNYLDELLDSLEKIPADVRNKMLAMFKRVDADAMTLIDGVWMKIVERKGNDWQACIDVFKKTIRLAAQWEANALAVAAACGVSIIYHEYLNNTHNAIDILNECTEKLGSSVILDNQKANVLFIEGRYKEALTIQENILPKWDFQPENGNTRQIFARRQAGIAAAHIGEWKKSAYYFREASQLSNRIKQPVFSTAFHADAGFAFWKAGEYSDSIKAFSEAVKDIEQFSDPEEDLRQFKVNKLTGHYLLWIQNELSIKPVDNVTKPLSGMCSNPDINEKLKELPITPINFSWLHLAQIEYYLKMGSNVFDRVYQRCIHAHIPMIRLYITELEIKHSFRKLDFNRLPIQSLALEMRSYESRIHIAQGYEVYEESLKNNILEEYETETITPILGIGLFVFAITALLGNGRFEFKIFNTWRDSAKMLKSFEVLNGLINACETIMSKEVKDAIAILMNKKESWENRMIAALRVSMNPDETPDNLFYAHSILLIELHQRFWIKEVEDYFADLISNQWLQKISFPASLITPKLTVPEIQNACISETTGIRKAAQILLVVSKAVSIKLPNEIRKQFRELAAKKYESDNPES